MPNESGYREAGSLLAARQYENANRAPEPSEPSLLTRTHELLAYLNQLEGGQSEIRTKLMGRPPCDSACEPANKRLDEPCLEELLAKACSLAASLVGEQKTILARI
jgi:hypothetical protein